MTLDEAIERYTSNAEYERTHGSLQGYLDFKQLAEWLKDYKRLKEQEPSGDAVSRQAVLELVRSLTRWCVRSEDGKFNNVGLLYDDVMFGIDKLQPVNPQEPKTGHWIALEEWKKEFKGFINELSMPKDDYNGIMEYIDEVPNEPKWIPVSERLPKIAGIYRVTRYYPNNVINPNYLVDACCFDGSNTWYDDNRINYDRAYADNVIAWQEDPEPYKVEPQERSKQSD